MGWQGVDRWLEDHHQTADTAPLLESEARMAEMMADPPRGLPGAELSDHPETVRQRRLRRERRKVR